MSWRVDLEAWLLRRWYGPRPIWLLLPLSWLFGALAALRRWLYARGWRASYRSRLPVLVVGNLTVGGAGKTPLVLALIEALRERGWQPGVISRGHGGSARRACLLPAEPDPELHGDEPSLIRVRSGAEVAVGRRRADAARLLESVDGIDLLIADDGLQHYALARDLEVLVIDGRRRFGNGALLPAGPLREPVSRALRAGFRVVNGGSAEAGEWPMTLRPAGFWRLADAHTVEVRPQAVHAVAGIGDPRRFFDTLHGLGFRPQAHTFPDHHRYAPEELVFDDDLPVLMTEKDAVKCRRFAREGWFALRVEADLPQALVDQIDLELRSLRRN